MKGRVVTIAIAVFAIAAIVVPAVALSASTKQYRYVTSQLLLPINPSEANTYGRDIDGDGHPDNALGQVFAVLTSQGFDLQSSVDSAVADGELLMLHLLRTPSLTETKDATWQVLYAEPTPDPDFTGSGSFTEAISPRSAQLPAKIKNGHVKTATGKIPLELTLGGGVFTLNLKDAKIYATCTKSACTNGRITGAITKQQVNQTLIPKIADDFTAIVQRDCSGSPPSCTSSEAAQIEQIFDTNSDLIITADELRNTGLIKSVLKPDLDLVKPRGNDAMSVGVGFQTVRAHF
jgi:hypothetical protein